MAMKNSIEEDGAAPGPFIAFSSIVWNRQSRKPPDWRDNWVGLSASRSRGIGRPSLEILYVVDAAKNVYGGDLVLSRNRANRNANGSFSRHQVLSMSQGQIAQLPPSEDREILSALPESIV